jgi:hypothetical protein
MKPSEEKQQVMSTDELRSLLLERHNRIKQERRAILNTLIGLSGGAIVLSMSLLKDIAPHKISVWIVITAWAFFALAVLYGLGSLVLMTMNSIKYQKRLEREFSTGYISLACDHEYQAYLMTTPSRTLAGPIYAEITTGGLFLLGTVFLGIFAVINLIKG